MKKILDYPKNLLIRVKEMSLKKKIILLVALIAIFVLVKVFIFSSNENEVSYEKANVTKGTLISSISGSGTITSVNSTNISSKVSGTVSEVYVSNGDNVTKGQSIALIDLDEYGLERQTSAWASYLDAQEAVKTAEKNKATADIDMWTARQAIIDAEDNIEIKNTTSINPATKKEYTLSETTIIDKSLEKAHLSYAEAELKYKNADSEIKTAKAQVVSALRDYQRNSAIIVAPDSGVVSNLNLAPGMAIASTSNSSTNSSASENSVAAVSAQTFGKISDPEGSLLATISLSEIDVINVEANQKATLIFDAYDEMSFTGSVLAVDTDGSSTSGVTSYSVTIVLDPVDDVEIYSNMAVTADIIIDVQTDVLLLPTTAIQTVDDTSYVQILENDELKYSAVEIGSANDSQTIVVSGLNEGDEIITSVISNTEEDDSSSSETTSPFSGISTSTRTGTGGGSGMGGGGGAPPGM